MEMIKEKYKNNANNMIENLFDDIEKKYLDKIKNDNEKIRELDKELKIKQKRILNLIDSLAIEEQKNRDLNEKIKMLEKNNNINNLENRQAIKTKYIDYICKNLREFNGDFKFLESDIERITNAEENLEILERSHKYIVVLTALAIGKFKKLSVNQSWAREILKKDLKIVKLIDSIKREKVLADKRMVEKPAIIYVTELKKEFNFIDERIYEDLLKVFKVRLKVIVKELNVGLNFKKECISRKQISKRGFFYKVLDNSVERYVYSEKGKYCNDCLWGYIEERDLVKNYTVLNLRNERVGVQNLKVNEYNSTVVLEEREPEGKNYSFIPNINNSLGSDRYESSTSKIESINLKEESELKKLGYNINLPITERERILKNIAIPKLGRRVVVNHINWLIRMNLKRKSMENAVRIWRFDLNKIL